MAQDEIVPNIEDQLKDVPVSKVHEVIIQLSVAEATTQGTK